MSTPIEVALIGYGYAGQNIHAPLLRAVPGLRLSVVASRQPDKVLADIPDAKVVEDPLAALARPDVELVVIASPNDTHAPLAEAALRAGKHVVVDKPFTVTLDEARDLAALAAKQQCVLSVFQNRRWDSDFLALRGLIAAGRLGEIVHLESRFDRFRPDVRERWRERDVPGGGLWYDLGPHVVDQALQLFGLPERVGAQFGTMRDGARTPDWCQVQLDCGRPQVTLHASVLVGGGMPRFAVHGRRGSWVKYGLDAQESQLLTGLRPGDPGWGADPLPGTYYPGDGSRHDEPVPAGNYVAYYTGLEAAIRGRGKNPVTPAEAVAVMAVIETAIAAAEQGRMLPLPLTDDERQRWKAAS
ncbi:oxidoreductase [Azoarcus sp. KH32C]|uniref:oxidoreductase n=1 Tax=Azoarcus sp. KH32C TaxID=748247 RepID=UPI0002386EF2|nr:oxidoreductase [Azoarcus sp. KH32C]BAL24989.1 oxidoreductase [Azoarcus sp. KH32C]